jgi:hypothetical protein
MYLRDDGRTRHGKLVTPDDPAAAPSAAAVDASAPGGVYDSTLPISPPHLWRGFTGPSVFTPINATGTPFPWTPRGESVSLALRQHSSSAVGEEHNSGAEGDGNQEKEDEEMSEGGEGEEEDEDEGKDHAADGEYDSSKK